MYLGNPSTPEIRKAMTDTAHLGAMVTPKQGNAIPAGVAVGVDNGCFTAPASFGDGRAFLRKLLTFDPADVLFANAPDVVGDWEATITRSMPWLRKLRVLGYPAAIVIQDGAVPADIPWEWVDCVFIGGTTEWKLGPNSRVIATEAKARERWLHMGRVNSLKRCRLAASWGCDSVDGTFLAFGPDVNLPKVLRWMEDINRQANQETLYL